MVSIVYSSTVTASVEPVLCGQSSRVRVPGAIADVTIWGVARAVANPETPREVLAAACGGTVARAGGPCSTLLLGLVRRKVQVCY